MSEQVKHTPGPWTLRELGACEKACFREMHFWAVDSVEVEICNLDKGNATSDGWITDNESLANAKLIAAAPDLLAACKAWLTAHDENMHLLGQGVLSPTELKQAVHDGIVAVRAAVLKAEAR